MLGRCVSNEWSIREGVLFLLVVVNRWWDELIRSSLGLVFVWHCCIKGVWYRLIAISLGATELD